MPVYMYPSFFKDIQDGTIDLDTNTIKCGLVTSSYTFSTAHDRYNDITNEVAASGGYSTGGSTVASISLVTTLANAWSAQWTAATSYALKYVIRPTAGNGYLYCAVVAGTSHASTQPTWSTVWGVNNTDNTVTWMCFGTGVTVLDATDVQWASSTITARGAFLYKDTGVGSTSPLICFYDFGSDKVSTGGNFDVIWPAQGIHLAAAA